MNKFLIVFIVYLISCQQTTLREKHFNGKETLSVYKENGQNIIRGMASYYAEKYHGRLTANGEVFDMNKYTCAHKTMAFGTKLRVTYPKTGKSVIVRVNDRGPYKKNRILDLSKAAAKKIGLFNDGVGEVIIEIL